MRSGTAQGVRISTSCARNAATSASASPSSRRATLARRLLEDGLRGLDAHIGADQPRLQVVQQLGIDLAAAKQAGEIAGQAGGAAGQAFAQSAEESGGFGVVSGMGAHCNSLAR